MTRLYIVGMPRSGTSMMAKIITEMGGDFLHSADSVDPIYPKEFNSSGYFQRVDLFVTYDTFRSDKFCASSDACFNCIGTSQPNILYYSL